MIACRECGKLFTPRHGNQKICSGCKNKDKKKPVDRKLAGRLRRQYGTQKGRNWKCNVFPNCENCPFPDCIDTSGRAFMEIDDESTGDV